MTWQQNTEIVLASKSEARQSLLNNAGLEVSVVDAGINEDEIKQRFNEQKAEPEEVAVGLASIKARQVSLKHRESFVIGGDQVLIFKGTLLSKPVTQDALRDQLSKLQGSTHDLVSAAAIAKGGHVLWRGEGRARITVRHLKPEDIDAYVDQVPEAAYSVGGYHIEGLGSRILRRAMGDPHTIQGLPLLELLEGLRDLDVIG
jgi:septum formation protein